MFHVAARFAVYIITEVVGKGSLKRIGRKRKEIFRYLTEERDSSYRLEVNFQRDKFNRVGGTFFSFLFVVKKLTKRNRYRKTLVPS